MEVVAGNEPTTRIKPGQSHEIGRAHGLDSSDKTISRRHVSLSVVGATIGDQIRLQFEVLGRNPIYVHKDNQVKIFRRFERGEMRNGDLFCVSAKNPVWYSVRSIGDGADVVRRNASEFSGEMEIDSRFKGVEDLDQAGVDISGLDPVKEFGFVVEGHEFDSYPTNMIRDIKNWDWFLEEKGKNGEGDEDEGKNIVKARGRGKRKKGGENDDEEDWSGGSEDERLLMDKSTKGRKAKYMTRSKDHDKPSDQQSSTRTENRDVDEDEDEDEDDETLGGFVVDDENMEEEEEGGESEEDEEELEDEDDEE